jgi:two-component system, cell cycle sensor histidine kinase and response regulator CckA
MGDSDSAELERLRHENAALRQRLEALQESERALRASFAQSPVAQALICGQQGRYVDVNEAFVQLTGVTAEQTIGKTSVELGLLAKPEQRQQVIEEAHANGVVRDRVFEIVRPDGQRRLVLVSLRALRIDVAGLCCLTLEDQTEQARTHAALHASEAQAQALLNALPDLLFEIDASGRIYDYRGARERLHVPPEVFLGKTIDDVLPAQACLPLHAGIAEAVATGSHRGASYSLESAGQRRWYEVSMAAKDVARSRLIVLIRDVTERKRAEERLRTLLSALPDVLLVVSRDGMYLEVHAACPSLLPITPEQLLHSGVRSHLPAAVADGSMRQIEATLATHTIQIAEYELSFKKGERRRYEVRTVPREDGTVRTS